MNKQFHDRITSPISNYLGGFKSSGHDMEGYTRIILDIHEEVRKARKNKDMDLVSYHKHCLGRQLTTFTTDQRLWVWDKPKYRLFVGNQKGICIELDEEATVADAKQALRDYVQDVQIPIRVDNYFSKIGDKNEKR